MNATHAPKSPEVPGSRRPGPAESGAAPAREARNDAWRQLATGPATPAAGQLRLQREETPDASTDEESSALFAEDDAAELLPGQMRKGEFLEEVRAVASAAAEGPLAAAGQTTAGCPFLELAFRAFARRSPAEIERTLRSFVPVSPGGSARDALPAIADRARQAAERWVETGDLSGFARELAVRPPETPEAAVQRRARHGGAAAAVDPVAVQGRLGEGQPLDGAVRRRMEGAMGLDLGGVRAHTDSTAAGLASGLDARAFTIGSHVAFGAGEFRPGTLTGDALIAHELAHVAQQSGEGSLDEASAEAEADRAAAGALVGRMDAFLLRKTRLRLQRCGRTERPTGTGIHYDEAVSTWTSGSPGEGLRDAVSGLTTFEKVERKEMLENLESVNAGGAYVFFGHGAFAPGGGSAKGVNPYEGKTVMGSDLTTALAADQSPPTLVVLGACGSASLLPNVSKAEVPVAVGFSESVSNAAGATAVIRFMEALEAGKTFAEAETETNTFLQGTGGLLNPAGAEIRIEYGSGYDSSMTLEQARQQHRGP